MDINMDMKNLFSKFIDQNEERHSNHGTSLELVLGQIAQLNDKLRNLDSKCLLLTDENITLRNELIIVKRQNDQSEKHIAQLKTETEELRTKYDHQFHDFESRCQILRDENIILRKDLNSTKDQSGSTHEAVHQLRLDTEELRKTIDGKVSNLEAQYRTVKEDYVVAKNELSFVKQQNEQSAKQVVQLNNESDELRKSLEEQRRYIELIQAMVNKITSMEKNVNFQIDSLREYRECEKETSRKVKILQQKLTAFIAEMNTSSPPYNNYSSPQPHNHQDHMKQTITTSSLLNGQMPNAFRTSSRHHATSPHFTSKNDEMLGPLDWKDDLSEISNMSGELFRGVKELHQDNNRRAGNGSNSLYSDE